MGGRSIIFLGSRILQSRFRQLRPAPDPSLNKEALSSGSDVYALPFLWTYMTYCKLYRLLQPRWHETFDRDLIHPLHIPLLPYFLTSPGARLISPERTSSFQYTNKKISHLTFYRLRTDCYGVLPIQTWWHKSSDKPFRLMPTHQKLFHVYKLFSQCFFGDTTLWPRASSL